jgi:predicted tellurium resistance membrane protein TerC
MDRYPAIITLGAMLLGWIAGSMALSDPALVNVDVLPQVPKLVVTDALKYGAGIGGALLVLLLGKAIAARRRAMPEP